MRTELVYGERLVRCFKDRPRSLFGMFEEAVRRSPQGVALVCGNRRLTYRELDREVTAAARALQVSGVVCSDRVALLLGNRIEFVVLLFAAARVGAIVVPLSAR